MPEIEFYDSSSGMNGQAGKRQNNTSRKAPALAGLIVFSLFLVGWAAISAEDPEDQALPGESTDIIHEPLLGQACIECHEQTIPGNGRCLLTGEGMCVLCHEIPVTGGQASLAEPSAPLCYKCHSEQTFGEDFVHGPYAAGACLTCHSPHGENDSAMVRITGRQMCLPCHEDTKAGFENARFRHEAAVTGCTECHAPHGSEQRYQLREPVPDICVECHEDFFERIETATVTHSPVEEDPACLNCHDAHMAENDWLLLGEDMDICLECHNEPIETDQYELAPMGPMLAAKTRHHGPIQFGICSECHNPHGSPYFRLLTDAYPARQYAPFFESNYALCFRCHESTLAEEERTGTLTEFRDGDLNLHYVHVNKRSMGRTCRLCHETHASSQPGHIRESVPFGTWDLPIKFKKTENGGSCEPGCHAAQNYDRLAALSGRL
jgi:predicted CXXCH cytochrome family protein